MSASRPLLSALMLFSCSLVLAADDEIPDVEFLEYLGMWQASDEDWMLFNESVAADADRRSDPVPQGKESLETRDES